MGPLARGLPGGRIHLQHGPIDLVIGAEGPGRGAALRAATRRFETVLDELVAELPHLRSRIAGGTPAAPNRVPLGVVARRMHLAAAPFARRGFVTPMIAVAGAVADEILASMQKAGPLTRAYVNNGGDIALHLGQGEGFSLAIAGHDGADLGRVDVCAGDGLSGVATSGRHGRSLSLGIADSVTVLAATAATADAAATLIANAVDLPGHRAITRRPACEIVDDSDLGDRPVVTGCPQLTASEIAQALASGRARAQQMQTAGLIQAASLHLQGHSERTGQGIAAAAERILDHA